MRVYVSICVYGGLYVCVRVCVCVCVCVGGPAGRVQWHTTILSRRIPFGAVRSTLTTPNRCPATHFHSKGTFPLYNTFKRDFRKKPSFCLWSLYLSPHCQNVAGHFLKTSFSNISLLSAFHFLNLNLSLSEPLSSFVFLFWKVITQAR